MEGMNLVLAALPGDDLDGVAGQVRGVRVVTVPTDVVDPGAREALIATANHEFGAVDLLVNNAGIEMALRYHKLRAFDIERVIQANLLAPMLLSRMVLPGMLQRGHGHIVGISSLAGKLGGAYNEPYAASKAGLIVFMKSLRGEYRKSGVSASVVVAGFVRGAGFTQRVAEETGVTPPASAGTSSPEDVARAVVRVVKRDLPEMVVAPKALGVRFLVSFLELFPSLNEGAMERLGASDFFERTAEVRERSIAGTARPDEP